MHFARVLILLATTAACGGSASATVPLAPQTETPSSDPPQLAPMQAAASEAPSRPRTPRLDQLASMHGASVAHDGETSVVLLGNNLYVCDAGSGSCRSPVALDGVNADGLSLSAVDTDRLGDGVWLLAIEWERQIGDVYEVGGGAVFISVENQSLRWLGTILVASERRTRDDSDGIIVERVDYSTIRWGTGCFFVEPAQTSERNARRRRGRARRVRLSDAPERLPIFGVDPFTTSQAGAWRFDPDGLVAIDRCE